MKAIKGLLIYIGIVFAILASICLVLFSVMYFVPSFRVFNVGVIHYSKEIKGEGVKSYYTEWNININSNNIDVYIIPKASKDKDGKKIEPILDYGLKLSVFGISTEITEYNVVKDFKLDSKNKPILTLNVSEPNGFISTGSSHLYLNVPDDLNYNLNIKTNSADVNLGNKDRKLIIKNLSVKTDKGKLNLTNVEDKETKTLNLGILNLSTDKGVFDFSNIDNVNVLGDTVIKSNKGDYLFKNLYSKGVVILGDGIKIVAENVNVGDNGFEFSSYRGIFKINNLNCPDVSENTIITDDCDLKIKKISGNTLIRSTHGDISVDEFTNNASISTNNGNVFIKVAKGNLDIVTELGDIKVVSYEKNGIFKTKKGFIDVNNNTEYKYGLITRIESQDGNVKVTNRVNELYLNTTGISNVDVRIKEIATSLNSESVFEDKIVLGEKSVGVVYMPAINSFKFKAIGKIDGQISQFNIKPSEKFQYFPTEDPAVKVECNNNNSFYFNGTITFKTYLSL